jgi:hypothetical protein
MTAKCAVCSVDVRRVVEPHWTGWLDDEDDQLSYVPTLHDHVGMLCNCHVLPEGVTCFNCRWLARTDTKTCTTCGDQLFHDYDAWRNWLGAELCGTSGKRHTL